jgi:hypothetical protein
MSDLYKEALIEAKALRQLAEEDATRNIVKEISPLIKKAISERIGSLTEGAAGSDDDDGFFFEQDTDASQPEDQQTQPVASPPLDAANKSSALAPTPIPAKVPQTAAGAESAPLSPGKQQNDGEEGSGLNASMPGEDGKITVDFEDLFKGVEDLSPEAEDTASPSALSDLGDASGLSTGATPGAPADTVPPATPSSSSLEMTPTMPTEEENEMQPSAASLHPESVSYDSFEKSLYEVSERVDRVYFKTSVNEVVHESLKNQLFNLIEKLDYLREKGSIDAKRAKINEHKLEFLFLKLKEAKVANSYITNTKETKTSMTSLKEFAAKLFEEESSTFAGKGNEDKTNEPTTASAKHAAKVSGVSPEVGDGPEALKAADGDKDVVVKEEMLPGTAGSVDADALPGTDPDHKSEEQWADGEPGLDEKNQDKVIEEALDSLEEEVEAKGSAGFGDTSEEPSVEFEIDDNELMEAIREIRKENVRKKVTALRLEAKKAKVQKGEPKVEASEEAWEEAEPEAGADPSHKKLKEAADDGEDFEVAANDHDVVDDAMSPPSADDDEMFHDDSEDEVEAEGDLVLNIDLPDEVEDALAGVDISALEDIDVSLVDVNLGAGHDENEEDSFGGVPSDEEHEEAEEDLEGAAEEHDEAAEDLESAAANDEDEEGKELESEAYKGGWPPPGWHGKKEGEEDGLEEAKKSKKTMPKKDKNGKFVKKSDKKNDDVKKEHAVKLHRALRESRNENESLKQNLKDANLFLAKNVYFTKFLQRGDLSKKNLGKIVDYLDSAGTVSEAKSIYGKIKAKLAESANKASSKQLTGSASGSTKSGSQSAESLKESINRQNSAQDSDSPVVSTVERWQQLAGIKPSKVQ